MVKPFSHRAVLSLCVGCVMVRASDAQHSKPSQSALCKEGVSTIKALPVGREVTGLSWKAMVGQKPPCRTLMVLTR